MKEIAFVKKNDHAVSGKCWILEGKERQNSLRRIKHL